jgi:ABC-2 type transport system permease protein
MSKTTVLAQLHAFWVLARARVAETARERSAVAFLLGFPALLLLSLALVFAEGHPYERRAVALDCANVAARAALAREPDALSIYPLSAREGRRALDEARVELRVVCDARSSQPATVWIEHGPRARLSAVAVRALFVMDGLDAQLRPVPVAKGAYARGLLPGAIAFGALFSGLYGLGLPMLRLRRRRVLARLTLTPLRATTLVLSQLSARAALTVGQSLVMLAVGALLFHRAPSASAVLCVVAAVLLGVLAFAGIGLALASVIEQEDTHGDLLAASATPMVLLSGAFFPVRELPSSLATIAELLPSTALVDACRAALDPSLRGLAAPLAILALWAVASIALGVHRFELRRS